MTTWLDPLAPPNRSAVVSGRYGKLPHSDHAFPVVTDGQVDVISDSLIAASEMLTRLTGGVVHPALQVVEEFTCYARTRSLRPSFQPVRGVAELTVVERDVTTLNPAGVILHAGSIRFTEADRTYDWDVVAPLTLGLDFAHWFTTWMLCPPMAAERISVTYNVGSTITASARQAVVSLAHEFYLQVSPCNECGECRLPDRTTNVNREGLSFNVSDPNDPMSTGATGLPDVDLWVRVVNPHQGARVRGVNPRQATRASGLYDPSSPPGVVRSVRAARPNFSAVPTAGPSASVKVTATGVVA